jgi:hypothetical protein
MARALARLKAGSNSAVRMLMMAMTVSNSTNVNAPARRLDLGKSMLKIYQAAAVPRIFQLEIRNLNFRKREVHAKVRGLHALETGMESANCTND